MIRSRTNEILEECSKLQELTEHLNELLSSEITKKWKGDGAQACLRESLDNRELASLAVNECRKIADLTDLKSDEGKALPSSLLL